MTNINLATGTMSPNILAFLYHIRWHWLSGVSIISHFNPLDAGRLYTDFMQTSLRRRTAVYRPNGSLPHAPADGIPAIRRIVDPRRRTVYNRRFLMHTGPCISEL